MLQILFAGDDGDHSVSKFGRDLSDDAFGLVGIFVCGFRVSDQKERDSVFFSNVFDGSFREFGEDGSFTHDKALSDGLGVDGG